MGHSQKIYTPLTEEISAVQSGGEENYLKNVSNLYRMFREGEESIVNSLREW